MLSTIYKWLAIAAAAAVGIFGIWAAGRSNGKATETVEATKEQMTEVAQDAAASVDAQQKATTIQVSTIKVANDVATKVNAGAPGAAADELRNKWSRDK